MFDRIETADSSVTINGGTIQNFNSTGNGAVFYVFKSNATITINGGTIQNNTGKDSTVVEIDTNYGGSLIINGGTIQNNTATGSAGGVYQVRDGNSLYLYGGTITNNSAPRGGAFYVSSGNANFYIGGNPKVYGNSASVNGGGTDIMLANQSTFEATKDLDNDALLYLFSSTRTNDTVLGTLTNSNDISNVFVDSNNAVGYRQENGQLLIGHKHDGLYYRAWTSTNSLPTASGNYFLVNDVNLTDNQVTAQGANIRLCLNGKTIKQTTAGKNIYRFWGNNTSITIDDCNENPGLLTGVSGSAYPFYMALGDVSHECYLTMNNGRISGNRGTGNGGAIRADKGIAHVTINGGEISDNTSNAGILQVINNASSEVIMNGGKIINNTSNGGNYGFAIEADNKASIKLLGGEISNNICTVENLRGVVKTNGTLTLGGDVVIQNNTANGKTINVSNYTGSRVVDSTNPLTEDAKIGFTSATVPTINTSKTIVAGDYSSYFTSDNDLYTVEFDETNTVLSVIKYTVTLNTNGGTINSGNITAYCYGTGATLPVDVTKPYNSFEGWYDNSEFTGDAVTSIASTASGNKTYYAKWSPDHDHLVDGQEVEWTPWTSANSLPTKTGNYYLTSDVTLTSAQVLAEGATVRLCLDGHTVTQTAANVAIYRFWGNNSTLIIDDCNENPGLLTGVNGNSNANIIYMSADSNHPEYVMNFILDNGRLSGATGSGAAVKVGSGIAHITINDGEISNNSTFGIHASTPNATDETFITINGGKISGNNVNANGSAIRTDKGITHLTINGGEISNNTSNAGIIQIINNANNEIVVNGGSFINNTSKGANYGYVIEADNEASVSLLGGSFTGNTCTVDNIRGVVKTNGTLTLGGNVVVQNNVANGKVVNLTNFAGEMAISTASPLSSQARIGFTPRTAPSARTNRVIVAGDYTNVFTSDNADYLIKYIDDNTVLTVTSTENVGGNLVLSDNIDAEIDFTLEGNVEDYTVSYSFLGQIHDVELTGKDVAIKVDDIFAFQMSDQIIVNVYHKEVLVDTISYSVKSYCKYQIENSSNENLVKLCKATLNYGAAAQSYFNGRSYNGGSYQIDMENLANAGVETTLIDVEKPTNEKTCVGDLGGKVTDVKYTLVVGSNVSMKFYIYTNEDLDLANVQIGCTPAKAVTELKKESTGKYSVKVEGIKAAELGTDFTVTITEGGNTMTITCSPYAYAASKWDANNSLANLCKKLVTYGEAARTY